MGKFVLQRDYSAQTIVNQYILDRSRFSGITGPVGSGKTIGSILKTLDLACEQAPNRSGYRPTRFFVVRNTYSDLENTTIKDWRGVFDSNDHLGMLGKFHQGGRTPPTHHLKFKLQDRSIVDCEVIFLALDRAEDERKLRGAQATGFYLNEIKELSKAVLDMAGSRIGRYPSMATGGVDPTWHGIFGDSNAPDDDHWLYELAEIEKPEGWTFFKQPGGVVREIIDGKWTGKWVENPLAENIKNLPENYYINQLGGKSNDWISVNLANEYGNVTDGNPVYRHQWMDSLHCIPNLGYVDDQPIAIGLDFGLTPAAIISQQQPNGVIHILDEILGQGMGIRQFTESMLKPLLLRKYPKCSCTFVGDPAGVQKSQADENTVFKELSNLGIDCIKGQTQDADVRFESVRYFLQMMRDGKPSLLVSTNCPVLRKGFNGGYKFRKVQRAGDLTYHEKADKNQYSHPHDALQYLMMWYKGHITNVVKKKFNRANFRDTVI